MAIALLSEKAVTLFALAEIAEIIPDVF